MSEICVWREAGPLASAALRKDLLPHLLGTPSSPQGLSRCPLQPHQEQAPQQMSIDVGVEGLAVGTPRGTAPTWRLCPPQLPPLPLFVCRPKSTAPSASTLRSLFPLPLC